MSLLQPSKRTKPLDDPMPVQFRTRSFSTPGVEDLIQLLRRTFSKPQSSKAMFWTRSAIEEETAKAHVLEAGSPG